MPHSSGLRAQCAASSRFQQPLERDKLQCSLQNIPAGLPVPRYCDCGTWGQRSDPRRGDVKVCFYKGALVTQMGCARGWAGAGRDSGACCCAGTVRCDLVDKGSRECASGLRSNRVSQLVLRFGGAALFLLCIALHAPPMSHDAHLRMHPKGYSSCTLLYWHFWTHSITICPNLSVRATLGGQFNS